MMWVHVVPWWAWIGVGVVTVGNAFSNAKCVDTLEKMQAEIRQIRFLLDRLQPKSDQDERWGD